jgi:phage tail sheath protein FI
MELLHPGVYIQETSSGVRPIEGVSTSTTAFIGKCEKGPVNRAFMVTSFIEFQANYGTFLNDSFLAHSALQYFNNGGNRLYVVRVAVASTDTSSISVGDRKATPAKTVTISAGSPGKWGNGISIAVGDGTVNPGNEFKITVQIGGNTVEVFDNLSIDHDAANFVEKVVAGSQFITAAADSTDTDNGRSVSGASPSTTLPTDHRKLQVNLNGDGPQAIVLADPCGNGNDIATAIQKAVRALTPLRVATPKGAFDNFTAGFADGVYTLKSGTTGKLSTVQVTPSSDSSADAAALLKLGTVSGGTENNGLALLRPAVGGYNLGSSRVGGAVIAVTPGTDGPDGTTLQDSDYISGLSALNTVTDVNIIAVPGIGTKAVVEAGANFCGLRGDCFFVGDMSAMDDTKEEAQSFVNGLAVKNSYAAVYFPWIRAVDPSGASPNAIAVPPSGFVTGIYARTDAKRGVWKAPAGTETTLGGATGLTKQLTDAEQDTLNPIGVNCIRFFQSSGIVIWGARTLATRSDPEYRYVPVRRLAIFIEQSLYNGIQWAVFEPNDDDLWASLRLNIGAFMLNLFRAGAFQGQTPAQAFYVKCDSQTNPQSQIDAGIVTVEVGFAPLRPAEFVVLTISQKAGDSAA